MTGAEIVGACRETAVGVLRNVLSNRSSSVDEMTRGISSELLQALGTDLEVTLRKTQPLLSDLSVLEEYTRFDEEHKKSTPNAWLRDTLTKELHGTVIRYLTEASS
ncbi:hypothetical protein ACHAXN_013201 [Cyclotella atomus]